jgi:hypothetical protein
MNILLRKLIREVITASSSTSASTDTAPDSSSSDKNDGGDKTLKQPEVAVEEYISSTYNAVPAKQDDEAKKLASTLKSNGIDTHDKVMNTLKNLEREQDGGPALADKIVKYQVTAEGRKIGKNRR